MTKPNTLSAAREHQRAERFKLRVGTANAKITKLERELKEARRAGFIDGSADTLATVYSALGDLSLCGWLSQRMMSLRVKTAPYHLPPEVEAMVRRELAEGFARCEVKDVDVGSISL
jgi:hypothetical protein